MTPRDQTSSTSTQIWFRPNSLATLAIGLLVLWNPASATEDPPSRIHFDRLALIGGGAITFRYLGFEYVERTWYQGQKLDHIRWLNDWDGATYLNFDKTGHFMGGLFISQTLNDGYTWAGFGTRTAAVLGTLTSWAALLEVEMRDAYFDQWGFSIPDFVANTGATCTAAGRSGAEAPRPEEETNSRGHTGRSDRDRRTGARSSAPRHVRGAPTRSPESKGTP